MLEYCHFNKLLEREQYIMDLLKLEYINSSAPCFAGSTHLDNKLPEKVKQSISNTLKIR